MRFAKTIGTLLLMGGLAISQTPLAHASSQGNANTLVHAPQRTDVAGPPFVTNDNDADQTLKTVHGARGHLLTVKAVAVNKATPAPKPHTSNTVHEDTGKKPVKKLSGRSGGLLSPAYSSVVGTAERYIGVPYVFGGSTPSGFDCSGFVAYVFRQHGISLSHSAAAQYSETHRVSYPEPGDLVFFNTDGGISHVGIYIGGGMFVSASGSRVQISSLHDSYWGNRYVGAGRI